MGTHERLGKKFKWFIDNHILLFDEDMVKIGSVDPEIGLIDSPVITIK